MRTVTTAYHNANKANTRSSDFLIVSDTGFALNQVSGADGWRLKSNTGNFNEKLFTMWKCNKKTSLSETNYGSITIGAYSEDEYFSKVAQTYGITLFFENNCYPTEYSIDFFNGESILTPAVTVTGLINDNSLFYIGWAQLRAMAKGTENLCWLKFRFTKWSKQNVYPVILFATYGKVNAVFTKDNLLSVNIVQETDITAQTIPYHSYSFTILDETDAYNPLISGSKIHDIFEGKKFRFFNFEKGFNDNEAIPDELSLFDHEVCLVGTAYFRNAKQHGTAVTFNLIDIIEKYDNIYLSDKEKRRSSHFTYSEIKSYLKSLFGNDLDISSIVEGQEAITPFYEESKMQILLYFAQLQQKYITVTNEGIITLKNMPNASNGFPIELNQSYQNPIIEKNDISGTVDVKTNIYSVSQNSELATNSIEFFYQENSSEDEELLLAYANADVTEIFDPHDEIVVKELPKRDFKILIAYYKFNNVYEKESLFVIDSETFTLSYLNGYFLEEYANNNFTYLLSVEGWDTELRVRIWFDSIPTDSDYEHALFMLNKFFASVEGSTITSSVNTVNLLKSSFSNDSSVTISNPAIADFATASMVKNWISTQLNNSAFSIETDWRGDCALELGDYAETEVAFVINGVKEYDHTYGGTVVKNVIDYNGALKMQTTLYGPTQDSLD